MQRGEAYSDASEQMWPRKEEPHMCKWIRRLPSWEGLVLLIHLAQAILRGPGAEDPGPGDRAGCRSQAKVKASARRWGLGLSSRLEVNDRLRLGSRRGLGHTTRGLIRGWEAGIGYQVEE